MGMEKRKSTWRTRTRKRQAKHFLSKKTNKQNHSNAAPNLDTSQRHRALHQRIENPREIRDAESQYGVHGRDRERLIGSFVAWQRTQSETNPLKYKYNINESSTLITLSIFHDPSTPYSDSLRLY